MSVLRFLLWVPTAWVVSGFTHDLCTGGETVLTPSFLNLLLLYKSSKLLMHIREKPVVFVTKVFLLSKFI